jgi:membrane protein
MQQSLKRLADIWGKAGAGSHAAATAYYAIFSLAPLVLIAIAVAGLFMGRDSAQVAILDQFSATFGADFRSFAESLLAPREEAGGIVATVVGGVLILLGASGVFGALREGLDQIFENLPPDKKPGLISGIIDQLVSVGMVLSLGFLLLASLIASTVLTALGGYLRELLPGAQIVAVIVDLLVTYVLISGFLTLMIAFLPSKRIHRRPALAGGFIAGAVFVVGKYGMSIYFALANPASAFGAAAAMVVVVLWAYYLAMGLFLSAVIARVFFTPESAQTPDHVDHGRDDLPSQAS